MRRMHFCAFLHKNTGKKGCIPLFPHIIAHFSAFVKRASDFLGISIFIDEKIYSVDRGWINNETRRSILTDELTHSKVR